jgi:hypothetical protein
MRNFRYRLEKRAQWISKTWYGKLLLMTMLLGERHEKVGRDEYTNTYLRSKGGVRGKFTPLGGLGHKSYAIRCQTRVMMDRSRFYRKSL